MRWSKFYVPTLKEAPADAEVISHQLMVRAGMIRKLTAGVYDYLPMAVRVIAKVSQVVREEMNRADSQEVLLPAVQPADLWIESGRWEQYGRELLRFHDRHDRDCCFGPTHEEVITDMVRGEVRSYRQLPLSFYQIQTKFRDEIRPRFGLMRGREFIMKDAYSFDRDDAGADASYQGMYAAYRRIFSRLGLRFRAVEADSGAIGGNFSHEFMVLAETGEDLIAACTACEYAANVERAEIAPPMGCRESVDAAAPAGAPAELPACTRIATPNCRTIEEVAAFLKAPAQATIKTLLLLVDGKPTAALVRGDRELNEIKLKNILNATDARMATPEEVEAWTGAPLGYAGPVNLMVETIIADNELRAECVFTGNKNDDLKGWIVGANTADAHYVNVSLIRDARVTRWADIRCIVAGDACPRCGGTVETMRGIEVGHVFKLGTKYSKAMNAVFLDENGKEREMIMGCYGIGVTRIIAAGIEQNHDDNGIVFAPPMAPFDVVLANLDGKSAEVSAKAEALYVSLKESGLDVLLDDRDERPGVKFKDMDLIGVPMQLILGAKGFARGIVEAKDRRSGEKTELPLHGFAGAFADWRASVLAGWDIEE